MRIPAPTLRGCPIAPALAAAFAPALAAAFPPALARALAATLAASLLGAPASAQLVTGQVVERSTRAPIASAMVHLLDSDGTRVTSIPTDGAGRFTLQVPEPGAWRVEAMRPGYVSAEPEAFEVEAGGVAVLPPLELAADEEALENLPVPPRTIVGRVVADGFDEPMPGVLVRALDATNDGVAAAVSDASGRFRLMVPEAGEYQVEASRLAGEQEIRERVEVGEAAGARVRLELPHESVQPGEDYYHRQTNLTRGRAQFAERREQGLGFHFDREALEGMDLTRPSDVFRELPGLRVTVDRLGNHEVHARMGWQCLRIHFNHALPSLQQTHSSTNVLRRAGTPFMLEYEPSRNELPFHLDDVDLDAIQGVEIYRSWREVPNEIKESLIGPLLWPPNQLGGCGVAIVWTDVAW